MPGRTPHEAWIRYAHVLQDALGCIAAGRFPIRGTAAGLRPETDYTVTLNDIESVPLKRPRALHLVAGQLIRIQERKPDRGSERYTVLPLAYTYGFVYRDDHGSRELLTFHWNRDPVSPRLLPAGHLHIGPGLLANPTVIRVGEFHHAHIPTGYVLFAAIVRFAIAELGVAARTPAWGAILEQAEAAYPSEEHRY